MATVGAMLLVACTRCAGAGANTTPLDIYAAGPTLFEVRAFMGDSNWWQGPPSFGVRPLDAETTSYTERFSVTQRFIHVGTAEELLVRYTVFDKSSSATSQMTSFQNAFGASPASPKVGDQVLYYGLGGTGGAPYITRTFVRLGQVVVQIVWSRKDGVANVNQLGKNAAKILEGLKKATSAQVRPSPEHVDPKVLPPPGLDVTLLGAARLPIEAWLVMENIAIPLAGLELLHSAGISDFVYGDYALNHDTHMEVRSALLAFTTQAGAETWAETWASGTPDENGIASAYIDTSGVEGSGEYHYFFTSGIYGAMLVCKASGEGEAASRACEGPMNRTAIAWKLGLAG
jgi:hypothetical protein